jgi:hypothetical protein
MYILLVALLIVAVLWFVMKPGWAPKPPDTSKWTNKASQVSKDATGKASEMTKQFTGRASEISSQAGDKASEMSKQVTGRASQVSKDATAKAGQMYQGVRGWFKLRSDTRDLAKQFKQWVSEAVPAKRTELYNTLPASAEGFAIWLSALSDKELEQFTQRVARFCASLNFDLAWLTDVKVSREPELKQAVEDSVLLYSLAAWRANNVQQDVTSFLAYQAWVANPNRHKTFGQELHQVLIERGLVTVPPELYLAPEQERLEQAATAIRQVADEHPAAFRAALRRVAGVSNNNSATTAAAQLTPGMPTSTSAATVPEPSDQATSAQRKTATA